MSVKLMIAGHINHRLATQSSGIAFASKPFDRSADRLMDVSGEDGGVELRQVVCKPERPDFEMEIRDHDQAHLN